MFYFLFYLWKRWELSRVDLAILLLGVVLTIALGLAGLWTYFLLPLPLGVIAVELMHCLATLGKFRFPMCTTAKIIQQRTEIRLESRGRHQPDDEIVYWAPVVEFETDSGTVTASYPVFSRERQFMLDAEYEIYYSSDDPQQFYFAGRELELLEDHLIRIGLSAAVLGVYLAFLLALLYG